MESECDHVWETLEDGTLICFEGDLVKKKGDKWN